MACPISIGDAQQIVHWGVEIYRKIKDAEGEIRQAGTQLEELDDYLGWLRKLIVSKSAVADQLDPNWNELLDRITKRMKQIEKVSHKINSILKIYLDNGSLSKYLFPFGKNPKSLRGLLEDLERQKSALHQELWSALLISDQTTAAASPPPPAAVAKPKPPPSPTLKPVKANCGIIFVDPHNQGRSKVAEAYTNLLREWTVRTAGTWAVKFAHSAGLRVRSRSNCVDVLQSLKPAFSMSAGGSAPVGTAIDSLFDNKFFDYPYKVAVKDGITKTTSRGINTNIFQTYDYILVFMRREFIRLVELQKALVAIHGQQVAPKGKGRIVHLGAYIDKDGNALDIADAKRGEDGKQTREAWNKTTSQVKLAVKAFLKDELEWKQPAKGAAQS